MRKASATKSRILDRAVHLAAERGLARLSIGALADMLGLSKSGLFAHFGSKTDLELGVLERAAANFADRVSAPAWRHPPGAARLRALFELWVAWIDAPANPHGCIFVAAAVELDDQPGPVRDYLHRLQTDWFGALAKTVRSGIATDDFRRDADPEQVVFQLYGILLAYHHRARMLRDPRAPVLARSAFESLLDALIVPPHPRTLSP